MKSSMMKFLLMLFLILSQMLINFHLKMKFEHNRLFITKEILQQNQFLISMNLFHMNPFKKNIRPANQQYTYIQVPSDKCQCCSPLCCMMINIVITSYFQYCSLLFLKKMEFLVILQHRTVRAFLNTFKKNVFLGNFR
jgi:hypothetical protein